MALTPAQKQAAYRQRKRDHAAQGNTTPSTVTPPAVTTTPPAEIVSPAQILPPETPHQNTPQEPQGGEPSGGTIGGDKEGGLKGGGYLGKKENEKREKGVGGKHGKDTPDAEAVTSQEMVTPARREGGETVTPHITKPSRHVQVCPPSTVEAYRQCLDLMTSGTPFREIMRKTGASWQALVERGFLEGRPEWLASVAAWQQSRALRLVDKAESVANQEEPAQRSKTTGPNGETTAEHYRTDSTMIQAALAGLLPSIHGKLATGQRVAISGDQVAVQIGPAPVNSLDDF